MKDFLPSVLNWYVRGNPWMFLFWVSLLLRSPACAFKKIERKRQSWFRCNTRSSGSTSGGFAAKEHSVKMLSPCLLLTSGLCWIWFLVGGLLSQTFQPLSPPLQWKGSCPWNHENASSWGAVFLLSSMLHSHSWLPEPEGKFESLSLDVSWTLRHVWKVVC